MGYMIEISESKFDELSENIEEMLRIGGKVMSCVDRMKSERMGKRMPDYRDRRDHDEYENDYDSRYGERNGYGWRGNNRRY